MRGTVALKLLGLSTSTPSLIARIRPTVALIRPGCFAVTPQETVGQSPDGLRRDVPRTGTAFAAP